MRKPFRQNISGTTLIEMMIGVAILAIISLGFVGLFGNINKALLVSKSNTLASNIAQEQMQIIRQKSFDKILVTTAAAYDTNYDPAIPYDPGYYPPESIVEGGLSFTRYTFIQVADEDSGNLVFPGAIADTGMKAVTVNVVWTQGTDRKSLQLKNVISNIETVTTNAIIAGNVKQNGTSTGISNAKVTIAENVGYEDSTNSSGAYSINLTPGSYRMYVSASGYFPQYMYVSVAANQTVSEPDIFLIKMASGTVRGTAWIADHLVISQVVGATQTAVGSSLCQEFVEVFNPSTYTWSIYGTSPNIDLVSQFRGASKTVVPITSYVGTSIAPSSYFLFANTTTVTFGGTTKTADAVFSSAGDYVRTAGSDPCSSGGDADGIAIQWHSSGNIIDQVGWTSGSHSPALYEGTPVIQGVGLEDGEQYVRKTSTSGVTVGPGRAYDSGSNNIDFEVQKPSVYPVRNSGNMDIVISGTPAYGAYVSGTDGLSQPVTAVQTGGSGLPPYAEFQLTSVATGTCIVIVTSGTYSLEISTVIVATNQTTYIPNSATVPTWPASSFYATILSSIATQGYVVGTVTDAYGNGIGTPSPIVVSGGGSYATASQNNKTYFLPISTGTYDITANAGNVNNQYVSQSSQSVDVNLGLVSSNVNFVLSQGGKIKGFVTRDGTNPLAGVAIVAYDSNGVSRDQEVTGSDGRFTLSNLSTDTYTVEPILDSGETASPASSTATLTIGATVTVATFTITGTFGTIRGSVTSGGKIIPSGVLIIATTMTISGVPPSMSAASLTGGGLYLTNSYEDGTYYLPVRGSTSTTYNLYGYYTSMTNQIPSVSTRTQTSISVTAGQTVSGINFSW